MSKIFKGEGNVLNDLENKLGVKTFQITNDYEDSDYIKYGDFYISLTRLNYSNSEVSFFNNRPIPNLLVGGFLNNYVTQITGTTIYENVQYQNDCLSKGRAINNYNERSNLYTFNLPTYSISGATNILTGKTKTSEGVYIVETLSSKTFTSLFEDEYVDGFFIGSNGIKYNLYKRTTPTNIIIGSPLNPYQIIPLISNPVFNTIPFASTDYYTNTDLIYRDYLYTIIHHFSGATANGKNPYGSLIEASNGLFYGSTGLGGSNATGVIYSANGSGGYGVITSLPSNCTNNRGNLLEVSNGLFYALSIGTVITNYGTIYSCNTSGSIGIVYQFSGTTDGAYPYGSLIKASNGLLYGTTNQGGTFNYGTIFSCTTSGNFGVIHNFTGSGGSASNSSLLEASNGIFYGTTSAGGLNGFGTVYSCNTSGNFGVLHNFTYSGGGYPYAALIESSNGLLYGTTRLGNGISDEGLVFKITKDGSYTIIHKFSGATTYNDGAQPRNTLLEASDGNIYGMTSEGGILNGGTIFKITPTDGYEILHHFSGTTYGDGAYPWSEPLLESSDGNIYGTTYFGGITNDIGIIFKLQFPLSKINFDFDLTNSEGEYIIKGQYKWTNFTYFSNLMGLTYTESINAGSYPYAMWNYEKDYYFVYLRNAATPTITLNTVVSYGFPLNIVTISPSFDGQTSFPLGVEPALNGSNVIVTVNGITLSTSEYYYSASTLYITSGTLEISDIINMVYADPANTLPVQTESYQITSIPNTTYPSYGQKVIYNTNTSKYEYWLDYQLVNQPVLSVNGQTLVNNVDFYVSSTDSRRLIFVDTLSVGDIITVFYNAITSNGTDILAKDFTINWNLSYPTSNNLGYFLVQLANEGDVSFSSPIYSGITFYGVNQDSYTTTVSITGGTYGQKILSKVTNYKNYYTISGDLIQTTKESDIVTFTIKTNALNNY